MGNNQQKGSYIVRKQRWWILIAVFAPLIAPHDPLAQSVRDRLAPPSAEHLLGTDDKGRDILSRVIYGARIALVVGIVSVVLAMVIGVTLGLIAGYYGGWLDVVIMRVMDGLFAFPIIILAIAMMAVMGFGVKNVIIAVAVGFVAPFARVTRGDVLAVREEPYIEAARLAGVSSPAIIARHILPNTFATYIVLFTVNIAYAIVVEAALSFLGLGAPPDEPSWGSMLTAGTQALETAPWMIFFPGIAISLTVFGLNLVGDAIRDLTDPRLRGGLG